MIHEDHGIAVRHKVVHYAGESRDVRGVQADRRLIQHIEDAGCPVADGAGQLHALPFTGGKRRSSAIQR